MKTALLISFSLFISIANSFCQSSNLRDKLKDKPYIEFEGTMLNGEKFSLLENKGKVIILNFWYVGCPPCMGEIPDLNKIYRVYKDSNFVMVSLAKTPADEMNEFIAGKNFRPIEKIEYPIIPACLPIADKYGIYSYPTTIIIDKKGIIRLVQEGAPLSSLKKFIAFYGDKDLPRRTKKMVKKYGGEKESDMNEFYFTLIKGLLNE